MWPVLRTMLVSPAGSFAFVFAGVIIVGWFMFWLHGKFVTMIAEHKHVKTSCENLDKRIESLRNDVHELRGDIQYIKNMVNVQVNTPAQGQGAMLQAHSPLSLTSIGESAAKSMGAEVAISRNWEAMRERIAAAVPNNNPYDIQTYCLEKIPVAPETFFDPATLDAFKLYAFRNGRTLFECLKVVGLLVRNKYFESIGLPLGELDAPQPQKP